MKTTLLLICMVTLCGFILNAQSNQPTITATTSSTQLVCPGDFVEYTVSFPSGYSGCQLSWTIKKGSGNFAAGYSASSSPTTRIIWQDSKPNIIEAEVLVKYRPNSGGSCSSPEEITLSHTNILRSVLQESLTDVGTSAEVPYCATQPVVTLSVGVMNIKNTGGAGQPPLTEVERYEWTIPAGWKEVGTTNTGTFYTPMRIIQIEPTNPNGMCSEGGEVKIRGVAGGANNCIGLPFSVSNQATIQLNRTPAFSLSAPQGYQGQFCGNRDPVVFTATSINCAATYNWTYPPDWDGPAQTSTNSTSVTPADTGGQVTVSVTNGTCNINRSFTVGYFDPALATPVFTSNSAMVLCSNGTGPVQIQSIQEAATYNWYGPSSVLINNTVTSPTNPLVTSTPQVTITAPYMAPTANGFAAYIHVSASRTNPNCLGSPDRMHKVWIGRPAPVDRIMLGHLDSPFSLCTNTTYLFSAIDPFNQLNHTTYYWYKPENSTIQGGQGTKTLTLRTSTLPASNQWLSVRADNICGSSSLVDAQVTITSCSGGGGRDFTVMVYPNPTSEELNVLATDEDAEPVSEEYTILLYDDRQQPSGEAKMTNGRATLNVKGKQKGVYYLHMVDASGNVSDQVRVMIGN